MASLFDKLKRAAIDAGKSFAGSAVNTAQLPYDIGRQGVAAVTRNPVALRNASQALSGDALNSIGGFAVQPLQQGVAAAFQPYAMHQANAAQDYANRVLGRAYAPFQGGANQAQVEAGQAKLGLLQHQIANSGLSYTDRPLNNALKAVPKVGAGVANAMFFGEAPGLSRLARAGQGAALMGTAATLSTAAGDKPTAGDFVKSAVPNAALGFALPYATGAVGTAGRGVVEKAPDVARAVGNVAQDRAAFVKEMAAGRPFPNLNENEVAASSRVVQQLSGKGNVTEPNDVAIYRNVQRKLGADVNDHQPVMDALNAIRTHENQQAIKEGGYAQVPGKAPKQGGFVTSVKNSPEVSAPVRKQVAADYIPRSTADLAAKAQDFAKKGSLTKARDTVNQRLAVPTGSIDDATVADSIATAKRLDGAGKHAEASAIYEGLDEHLRAQGQGVQAASLLSNRTPEGLKFKAERDLRKAGVSVTPELRTKLEGALSAVRDAKPGNEHDYAVKRYQKLVADQFPSSAADKLTSLWKAGLLTGQKTQTGNISSNTAFALLHDLSSPGASLVDRLLSLRTGQRTSTATLRGKVSGAAEGTKAAGRYLKTGIDERGMAGNKFEGGEINFKNKAVRTYVNGVFRVMGAADRPFYYSQLRNSLYDLAQADAMNKDIKGKALAAHIDSFVKDPPKEAFQLATRDAEKSVLGYDTMLSRGVGRLRKVADDAQSPLGRGAAKVAINTVAPFTKVPSAFLSRTIDFTPVGAVKEAAVQISRGQLDQRALSRAISEATTGTALIYLGKQLADSGQLSGAYPTDPKEQQRWKAEGIQPNSIKVRGKWLSMNYLGPAGLLFNAGARANDVQKQGGNIAGQTAQAIGGAPKDLLGQSFLQGTNNLINAANDPGRYLPNVANQQAGSVVPTLVGDVANATDRYQRLATNAVGAIEAKIPGARQRLPIKQDVYGNPLERKSSAVDTLFNPLRPSNQLTNPVINEVGRLHASDPQNKDLQVTPTVLPKTVTFGGVRVNLNDNQRYLLQQRVGQATQDAWSKLIQTPEYQALDDPGKAKALNNLRQDMQAVTLQNYAAQNQLGQFAPGFTGKAKPLSKSQAALENGIDFNRYTRQGNESVPKVTNPGTVPKPKKAGIARLKSGTRPRRTYKATVHNPYRIKASPTIRLLSHAQLHTKSPVFKVKAAKPRRIASLRRPKRYSAHIS